MSTGLRSAAATEAGSLALGAEWFPWSGHDRHGRDDSHYAGDTCNSQSEHHGSSPTTQELENKVVTKPVYGLGIKEC
jgi:hypothetical protein